MKPLNEIISSICHTLECEYKEEEADKLVDTADGPLIGPAYICSIIKDGKVLVENFACPISGQPDETTREIARHWLLFSLISKAINQ